MSFTPTRPPSTSGRLTAALAGCLAVGLALTTGVVVPAAASPSTLRSAAALDATFVQEGTPSPHGGQVMMWGERDWAYQPGMRMVPAALPDGVLATAISAYSTELLVLRSDGLVDGYDSAGVLDPPDPASGTSYTGVSASSGFLLRSDGVVVDAEDGTEHAPPEGTRFVAVSGYFALRADGAVAALDDRPGCAAAREPASGLRYTALSSAAYDGGWAAVRSDGALVRCEEQGDVVVTAPRAGTRFVGVDRSAGEVLAATSDGRIVAARGAQPPAVPAGRSVVSLAAMGPGQGAAVLDDGSVLRWGLSGADGELPALPDGRATYSAVESGANSSHRWTIVVGAPIPVDVTADVVEPVGRPLRVTDEVAVDVAVRTADGAPAYGHVTTTTTAPDDVDGRRTRTTAADGTAQIVVNPSLRDGEGAGTWEIATTFSGSPYATTTVTEHTEVAPPSPVRIVASGPTTWRQSAFDGTVCLDVESEDGSPVWSGQFSSGVQEEPTKNVSGGFAPPWCGNGLDLAPGTWTMFLHYQGWGAVDAASWSGSVVVREPATSVLDVEIPASWRYGGRPHGIPVEVTAEELAPAGIVSMEVNGEYSSGAVLADGKGSVETWVERVPGTYLYRFVYEGGFGALPAVHEQVVRVLPALFAAQRPSVTGTAKVGSVLSVRRGTWTPEPTGVRYRWEAGGTPIAGATDPVLTVPASAVGKPITVTVTGDRRHHEQLSVESTPTAKVVPGTISAPRPRISGTAKVGRTLTVSRGTWSPAPSSATYQWKANGTIIATRTTSTFVVPASARGKKLTVTVVGGRAGYTTRSVTSTSTSTVAAGTVQAARPRISGTAKVGATLTVRRGTWSPSPAKVTYVWKAGGKKIATRTDNRFVVPERARGKRLTVTVTGTRDGYLATTRTSPRTAKVR